MSPRESQAVVRSANLKVGPEVYLASQLAEISSRFPGHIEDLRDFLLKEKLPVPSPDAIPEVAERLESDTRFRADVGSLLRATLYRERERVGHEDLLGILVAAAAGTKSDLKSDAETTAIREMLRFVMQSRRTTFRVDATEESDSFEAEVREPVAVAATARHAEPLRLDPEPVLAGRLRSRLDAAAETVQADARSDAGAMAVGESESGEAGDLVLPVFRTSGLFAAQTEREAAWWRAHPAWIAGVICMLLGVGLGLAMHRVVSAAEMKVAARVASSASKPTVAATANGVARSYTARNDGAPIAQPVGERSAAGVGAGITESPVGTVLPRASMADGTKGVAQPAPPLQPKQPARLEGRAEPPIEIATAAVATRKSSAVPVTVVKQIVTAWPDPDDTEADPPKSTSATTSIVPRASAGVMPADVIFSPAPEYPAAASVARVHGQVTVRAVVDPDGNVIYAHAVSGPEMLRDAAAEAVRRWRYRPLIYNGKPIAASTVAVLDFKMAK